MKRLWVAPVVAMMGCAWGGNLDRAQHQAHLAYYNASDALVLAGTTFRGLADQMAAKKHAIQNQYDSEAWARWVRSHTGKDGKIQASATQLTEAVKALEERRAKQRASERSWASVSKAWGNTLARFGSLNKTLRAKDVEWQKAKEDASAALNAAIQALATAGMGIGIGAAL